METRNADSARRSEKQKLDGGLLVGKRSQRLAPRVTPQYLPNAFSRMVDQPEPMRLLAINRNYTHRGISESRTTALEPGEKGRKEWLRVLSSQFSPVRYAEELCEIPAYFACFGHGTAEFLYRSDCVAERGDSNPRYSF